MDNRSARSEAIRWRWSLPTLALAATVLLWARSPHESHPAGMGYTTPSLAVEGILNFPTHVLDGLLRTYRLIYLTSAWPDALQLAFAYAMSIAYVVAFWAWIGWSIDTRKRLTTRAHRVPWICVYVVLFSFCIWVVWLNWFEDRQFAVLHRVAYLMRQDDFNWLWAWSFDRSVGSLWFVAGAIYFGEKALRSWRPSSDATSARTPR